MSAESVFDNISKPHGAHRGFPRISAMVGAGAEPKVPFLAISTRILSILRPICGFPKNSRFKETITAKGLANKKPSPS